MSPRPYVIANFAITADGKVSTASGEPSLFSSKRDKQRLLEIRALGDALMVGASTLGKDTMTMGIPDARLRQKRLDKGLPPHPLRIILSNSGPIDPAWRVFQVDWSPIILFRARPLEQDLLNLLEQRGVKVVTHGEANHGGLCLQRVLKQIGEDFAVSRLVCEGGPRVVRSLFEADCVDELYLTWCPVVFGGRMAPTLTGTEQLLFPRAVRLQLQDHRVHRGECFAHYKVVRG
ncbi:MAG: dihydrofolate reductase family protein [Verrucomicrobiia bacterium]